MGRRLKTKSQRLDVLEMRRKSMPEIAVDFPVSFERLQKYRDTGVCLFFERYGASNRFRRPVSVKLEPGFSRADIDLLNYVAESLSHEQPSLIPFAWENKSMRKLMAYLRRYKTASLTSPAHYTARVKQFLDFVKATPDRFIASCFTRKKTLNQRRVQEVRRMIEEWIAELTASGRATSTIAVSTAMIKTWLQVNGIDVGRIMRPKIRMKYPDRAPRPEELQKMLDVADLRGKVMISILALSGVRIGTLVKLKYKHVKEDLEAGRVPVCIRVPAEITKGKYADYFTFISEEAVNYLKMYLEYRRRGSPSGKIPPEIIHDESPLIRTETRIPRHLSTRQAQRIIHNIMVKAGLIQKTPGKGEKGARYELRVHSLRKYFKTQLTAAGVPVEYVEFMMGHKTSTYLDVKMKGVEFLRGLYAASGISIRPKTQISKIEMLKEMVRIFGYDPEKVLVREALQEPHRTVIGSEGVEGALRKVIKEAISDIIKQSFHDA